MYCANFKNLTFYAVLFTAQVLACRPRMTSVSDTEAQPHNRFIIGNPSEWVADDFDPNILNTSMTERRKAGWSVIAKALQPIPVVDPATGASLKDTQTGEPLTIPAWQTWYELDEFFAMMHILFWEKLNSTERSQLASNPNKVDEVMKHFGHTPLTTFWTRIKPGQSQSKFEKLLGQFSRPEDVHGINGITTPSGVSMRGFSLYSPALIRHYLLHYGDVARCKGNARDTPLNQGSDFATCFGKDFPDDAVAVKTTWTKANEGIAVFDTTAEGIKNLFENQNKSWTIPATAKTTTLPNPQKIYQASTFLDDRKSATFNLAGLHITSKTRHLPQWLWISLWWSDRPDQDFGEDRPSSITHIESPHQNSPWSNYKMCVVSDFVEQDPALRKSNATTWQPLEADTSLASAEKAAARFNNPNTFCSNPFLEIEPGFGGTNCVGCHQHAGLVDVNGKQRPDVEQKRQTFMSDFLWSFDNTTESFRSKILRVINDAP